MKTSEKVVSATLIAWCVTGLSCSSDASEKVRSTRSTRSMLIVHASPGSTAEHAVCDRKSCESSTGADVHRSSHADGAAANSSTCSHEPLVATTHSRRK